jgi:hypothetical protein
MVETSKVNKDILEDALDTLWKIFIAIGKEERFIEEKEGNMVFARELTADELNYWEESAWNEFDVRFGWLYKLNDEEIDVLLERFYEEIYTLVLE